MKKDRKWTMVLAALVLVFCLQFPLYTAILGSITPYEKIGQPSLIPRYFHWQNFVEIWRQVPLAMYMLNSIFYALLASLLAVGAALPAGYAVSRFRFAGRNLYMFLIMVTQMVAISMIIIPIFRMVNGLGLFDSRLAVVFLISALPIPMVTWLLKNYFDTIPIELEEAAAVDGCTQMGALLRVLMPVAIPGVVTGIIIAFTNTYNQFFLPMVILSTAEKYPALVGVYTMSSSLVPPWHLVMTASMVTLIPPLLIFFVCQKYVLGGMTAGSVKA